MDQHFTHSDSPDEFTVDIDEIDDPSISCAVIRATAALTGDELHEMPPIYEKIVPEALDKLMTPAVDDPAVANTSVTFHYCGFRITVSADGNIIFQSYKDE